jgi:hypothetical protein
MSNQYRQTKRETCAPTEENRAPQLPYRILSQFSIGPDPKQQHQSEKRPHEKSNPQIMRVICIYETQSRLSEKKKA